MLCRLPRRVVCGHRWLCRQQVTAAPWVVGQDQPGVEERAAASIREHGFVVLPGLVPVKDVEKLSAPLQDRLDGVLADLRARGAELDVGSRAGFREVVLRSPGRFDVPCPAQDLPREVLANIEGITSRLLEAGDADGASAGAGAPTGASAPQVLEVCGVVRADPGCPAQLWHADSAHDSPEHRPPNLLNVLVALRDITPEDGPTEVVPGTQVLTNHLRPGATFTADEIVYQRANNSPERVGSAELPVRAAMPAGSAIIFDDRVLHRGGGNPSDRARDVAFFSYRRADFQPSAYYEATRSLHAYDHRGLATAVRPEFPGLAGPPEAQVRGKPSPVFADGASGSQLHQTAIDAMVEQMRFGVANMGGGYASSHRVGSAVVGARGAMADFLNCSSDEIAFGPTMTALTYHVARAIRRSLKPGDNLVLDPMSHGANVWPWVQIAEQSGAEVRWLPVSPVCDETGANTCILDVRDDELAKVIDCDTVLVAAGAASNGVGSIHDVRAICAAAKQLSAGRARSFVDAVHYAPHCRVDVSAIGCDMLACSPYKFFGPHSGVLYARRELMASLPVDRLDCQDDGLPREGNCFMSRFELGTQNFEALAGLTAAVNYVADVGIRFGGADADAPRQDRLEAAWRAIESHESELKLSFLRGIKDLKGVRMLGVQDTSQVRDRTATFAVAKDGHDSYSLAEALCARGVWCTGGNHYAGFWGKQSGGLASNDTGMTRIGFLHYNTLDEIARVLEALESV